MTHGAWRSIDFAFQISESTLISPVLIRPKHLRSLTNDNRLRWRSSPSVGSDDRVFEFEVTAERNRQPSDCSYNRQRTMALASTSTPYTRRSMTPPTPKSTSPMRPRHHVNSRASPVVCFNILSHSLGLQGLFSVVNSTFVIGVQSKVKPDPNVQSGMLSHGALCHQSVCTPSQNSQGG